ncbi:MAG: transcription termination factor NusA, partial [SAR324 cluster bacterium]|nr:transcription termination factor NusA [SAR324 cluster bacterium]
REMIVSTFEKRVGEVLTGTVLRSESNGRIALRFLDKTDAYLFRREQIPGENFSYGDHIRVYLMDVNNNPQKPSQLSISRTHPGLLIKLFEMEVPEIYDGIVKIVSAAREPGKRAKISVYSTDPDVDPVGSCVGIRGSRVQNIVNELYGEKIDIVRWNEDVAVYTTNALAPAVIDELVIDEEAGEIDVIVKQDQLSLAIGSKGQNVRLASRLVGYKINISVDEEEAPSIEEQLTRELERGKEERELLYTGITSGLHAAGTPAAEAAARRNEDVAATKSEDSPGEEVETEAVSADPAIEETETAATVTEPTESDKEPDTSAQTADPSETTEEKPS